MQTEHDYLKDYDPRNFPTPLVTVDSVLFTLKEAALCVLMVKRANHPQKGYWALPGGFIDIVHDTDTRATALRKLVEKTAVNPPYLEQLESFSGRARDPRGWSLTTVYFALMAYADCRVHIEDVSAVEWIPFAKLSELPDIAFDHQMIIEVAVNRLKQKTMYSMLPFYCLPEHFTLSALQSAMEIILEQPLQRKSLIRRFESSNMFEETGEMATTGARKAKLYRKKSGVDIVHFSRNLIV